MDNKVIHANFMSIVLSETDCDIVFKTLIPDQDVTGKLLGNIIYDSLNVFMSIQQAKALTGILKQQIDNYEKIYGVLPEPKHSNILQQQIGTVNQQDGNNMEIKV